MTDPKHPQRFALLDKIKIREPGDDGAVTTAEIVGIEDGRGVLGKAEDWVYRLKVGGRVGWMTVSQSELLRLTAAATKPPEPERPVWPEASAHEQLRDACGGEDVFASVPVHLLARLLDNPASLDAEQKQHLVDAVIEQLTR